MTPYIHPMLTTFLLGVTFAFIALKLVKMSYRRSGRILIVVAVIITILLVYKFHEDQVNDAGRNLSASFGLLETLIKEGRLEECVEVLEQGSEIFTSRTSGIREESNAFLSLAYNTHQNKEDEESNDQSTE